MRYRSRYRSALQADRPIDPVQYAYNSYMAGREVTPIRMAGMIKTFVSHRELSLIDQICAISGFIAVASKLLTKRQRIRYSEQRIKTGRAVFYLFPARFLPADVGAEIKVEDDVMIYQ